MNPVPMDLTSRESRNRDRDNPDGRNRKAGIQSTNDSKGSLSSVCCESQEGYFCGVPFVVASQVASAAILKVSLHPSFRSTRLLELQPLLMLDRLLMQRRWLTKSLCQGTRRRTRKTRTKYELHECRIAFSVWSVGGACKVDSSVQLDLVRASCRVPLRSLMLAALYSRLGIL